MKLLEEGGIRQLLCTLSWDHSFVWWFFPDDVPIKMVYLVLKQSTHQPSQVYLIIFRLPILLHASYFGRRNALEFDLDMHGPLHKLDLLVLRKASFPCEEFLLRFRNDLRINDCHELLVLLFGVPILRESDYKHSKWIPNLGSSYTQSFIVPESLDASHSRSHIIHAVVVLGLQRELDPLAFV